MVKNKSLKIKILRDELVYDGKFIQVIARHFVDGGGNQNIWETVRRKTHGNSMAIVAITKDREIILEKTFRVPLNCYVFELPAGLIDKKGESEPEAIRRELLEETGYQVNSLEELVQGPLNTALLDDIMVIYLGTDAYLVQKPQLEDTEDIEVVKIPLDNFLNYLLTQKEVSIDFKVTSVIPYLQKRGLL